MFVSSTPNRGSKRSSKPAPTPTPRDVVMAMANFKPYGKHTMTDLRLMAEAALGASKDVQETHGRYAV